MTPAPQVVCEAVVSRARKDPDYRKAALSRIIACLRFTDLEYASSHKLTYDVPTMDETLERTLGYNLRPSYESVLSMLYVHVHAGVSFIRPDHPSASP